MIEIVPLSRAAPDAVEAVLDAAFGTDRHGRTAYRMRAGVHAVPHLSFAAFDGDALIGTLQMWPVELAQPDGRAEPLVLLGPVAVIPCRQRDGIGRKMMDHALRAADSSGETALMLIGDPEYYGRFFGFDADATGSWEIPGPVERRRLLARLTGGRTLPATGAIRPRQAALAG
ncbi:GNAT family N-acetyltransferase [Flavisphingomonas formosensis]|uniref:GNAT family N-acetyltransferase n=1 Tax=Flavisphingomonas formosensis TaxID=861534 RepID=UPI0012F9E0EF|nr:N-acetyltransferase [Sphingomonas formosensis]